ncbi:2-hydroxyglutaryl-CoA dehydratase [Candidatus Poribacteria bacterium]|nr:2-hydroxyglutaryl-CoA dehydratase [Candidatus Poribacteria bacterium]
MKKFGIDLGSRQIKIINYQNGKFGKFQILDTAQFYKKFAHASIKEILKYLEISEKDKITTTGYGRNLLKIRGLKSISELFAHSLGAAHQTGLSSFILLDIGAQDCKVIQIRDGKITDFLTNDKCAASTGRFLENMSQVLGVTLEEICKHYKKPIKLNSTCAIFTESELIGKLSEGYGFNELCAGVNYAIYEKISPLLNQFQIDKLVMAGGGGLNFAIKKIIEKNLKLKITVPAHPQFTGAMGCCLSEE